jgi:predicted  nucleic acid-binding Zn-ribbon protein
VNPERTTKWGDSRLDDEFQQIREELHDLRPLPERVNTLTTELRAMRDLPKNLAEFAIEFRGLRKDVGKCFDAIRDAENKREKREEVQRAERKTDRRWMFGAVISAAGLIIATIALLVPH